MSEHVQEILVASKGGRIVLHLILLFTGHDRRRHFQGIWREVRLA